MAPSAEITRAHIERRTALIEYQRAKVELLGKLCLVAVAALSFSGVLVAAGTAVLLRIL